MARFMSMEAEHSGSSSDDDSRMHLESGSENVHPNPLVTACAGGGGREESVQFLNPEASPSIASRQASATPSEMLEEPVKRQRGRPRGSGKGKPPLAAKRPVGRPRKHDTTPIPMENHPGNQYLRSAYEPRYNEKLERYEILEKTLGGKVALTEKWGDIGPIQQNVDNILVIDDSERQITAAATKAHPAQCTHAHSPVPGFPVPDNMPPPRRRKPTLLQRST